MNTNKALAIDTMWTFLAKYGQKANPDALEDAVQKLITMTTQKTGGQRKHAKSGDIDIAENLEGVMMEICAEATALVLSETWDKVKEMEGAT